MATITLEPSKPGDAFLEKIAFEIFAAVHDHRVRVGKIELSVESPTLVEVTPKTLDFSPTPSAFLVITDRAKTFDTKDVEVFLNDKTIKVSEIREISPRWLEVTFQLDSSDAGEDPKLTFVSKVNGSSVFSHAKLRLSKEKP